MATWNMTNKMDSWFASQSCSSPTCSDTAACVGYISSMLAPLSSSTLPSVHAPVRPRMRGFHLNNLFIYLFIYSIYLFIY